MEAYLVRGNFTQDLDALWLDRFPIAQKILYDPSPENDARVVGVLGTYAPLLTRRQVPRLPKKRTCPRI
jgi:hypothetical protein